MGTIYDDAFAVGLTFDNANITIGGTKIEELVADVNTKAPLEHTHTCDKITDLSSTLENTVKDYIKKDSVENASITGVFSCNDLMFSLDGVSTSLATKIKSLNSGGGAGDSMTIQHLTLTYDPNIRVGDPVFFTGEVASKDFLPIIISSTDCVPLVKSTGDWTTFAGICTEVDVSYKNKTTTYYRDKNCAFIRFATHGDFQMAVNDSSKYKVGDLIMFDGSIVNTDEQLSYKTQKSIVGSVTAIVSTGSVAVFRI